MEGLNAGITDDKRASTARNFFQTGHKLGHKYMNTSEMNLFQISRQNYQNFGKIAIVITKTLIFDCRNVPKM